MKSRYRTRPIVDEELSIRVREADKCALFAAAEKQDLSVSQFVRRAIAVALSEQQNVRAA